MAERDTTVKGDAAGETASTDRRGAEVAGRADDETLTAAATLLRGVLEALPPERPRDAATARRLEGAVIALEQQSREDAPEE